jgi:hypothetical protein
LQRVADHARNEHETARVDLAIWSPTKTIMLPVKDAMLGFALISLGALHSSTTSKGLICIYKSPLPSSPFYVAAVDFTVPEPVAVVQAAARHLAETRTRTRVVASRSDVDGRARRDRGVARRRTRG